MRGSRSIGCTLNYRITEASASSKPTINIIIPTSISSSSLPFSCVCLTTPPSRDISPIQSRGQRHDRLYIIINHYQLLESTIYLAEPSIWGLRISYVWFADGVACGSRSARISSICGPPRIQPPKPEADADYPRILKTDSVLSIIIRPIDSPSWSFNS